MADEQPRDDDGKVEMVIFADQGRVIQRFEKPMIRIAYDPKNVGEVVNGFLAAVKEAGFETIINLPKRKITKAQRDALVTRAVHVYRSMTEQHRPPADVARHVVDSVLSAIE